LHNRLRKRKYRMLFSPQRGRRPGPKGPNQELIDAVVAMKRRNPRWGCPRIGQQIALAFGVEIEWTDVRIPDPAVTVGAGRAFFRADLLRQLRKLIDERMAGRGSA